MSSFSVIYKITENASELYYVVELEVKGMNSKRVNVGVFLESGVCTFKINASDFTSFRAMNNSVTKMITVFNKIGALC